MRAWIKRIPIPMAGLTLGLAALGNLLQSYSETLRWVCGGLSAVLWLLVVARVLLCREETKRDLGNSILASVSATIFMTAMQLAAYAQPFLGRAALVLWCAAVACHGALIVWFTWRYLRRFRLSVVYPTYVIAYVGNVVASVTSPTFGMEALGTAIFWFGFAAYMVMLVLVTVRYCKIAVADSAKPLFCIYTAPMSLSLAGYLSAVEPKSVPFLIALEIAAQILLLVVLSQLPKLLRLPFYPSYAAFTFPFVITAFALKKLLAWFAAAGYTVPVFLEAVLVVETILATAMVGYALVRYLMYLFGGVRLLIPAAQRTVDSAE